MHASIISLFVGCRKKASASYNIAIATQTILKQFDPKPGVSVATLTYEYPPDFRVPKHAHGSDQLIYAIRGVMEVSSGQSMWLIPPHYALWIPARTEHRIHMPGAVSMRTLYFRPGLVSNLPSHCAVLHVSPLLRELILETVRIGRLRVRSPLERALRDLAISHLESASPVAAFITLPRDTRALAVARSIVDCPAQPQTLAALCAGVGVSVRTIQRAFLKEVGLHFESWRRQVRLTKAIELLVQGYAVKQAAFAVGYRQCSAFTEAFRRTFGTTPKAWIVSLGKLDNKEIDIA